MRLIWVSLWLLILGAILGYGVLWLWGIDLVRSVWR